MRLPFALLLVGLFLGSCWERSPKLRALNDRFTYWAATSDHAFIVEGGSSGGIEVVPGHIDLIAHEGDWVFGHISPSPHEQAGTKTPESARGFFHFQLSTGRPVLGLQEAEWSTFMKAENIVDAKQRLKLTL